MGRYKLDNTKIPNAIINTKMDWKEDFIFYIVGAFLVVGCILMLMNIFAMFF